MYYMVMMVIDDVNRAPDVLEAWHAAGAPGITIVESTGMARFREYQGIRDDMPLMPSLRALLQSREEHHRTIFSIVEGEEMVERLIRETEAILGDLTAPHTGVLVALPVARVAGLPRLGGAGAAGKSTD